jgi:hypothetical protein
MSGTNDGRCATCEDCKGPIRNAQSGKRRWTHRGKYGYVGYVNVHRKCPRNHDARAESHS